MEILTVICSISAFMISLISLVMGIVAFIELRAFMKSTHKVEFVPMVDPKAKAPTFDEELEKFGL